MFDIAALLHTEQYLQNEAVQLQRSRDLSLHGICVSVHVQRPIQNHMLLCAKSTLYASPLGKKWLQSREVGEKSKKINKIEKKNHRVRKVWGDVWLRSKAVNMKYLHALQHPLSRERQLGSFHPLSFFFFLCLHHRYQGRWESAVLLDIRYSQRQTVCPPISTWNWTKMNSKMRIAKDNI